MANREALRELQARLASRLQTARDEGVAVSWLAVEAGGHPYLLPLGQAGEIFPWTHVQAVPYTSQWFMGVANLRGGLYGIVDLAGLIAHGGAAPAPRSELALADASLLVFNAALDINAALLIDRLVGLRSADAFTASQAPAAGAPAYFGAVYTASDGARWQEISLQKLAQDPVFLSISA
ncbi:chemotaxis protein CheW [Ramlibacter sp. H39-3-26]|uniref:chemotaxis protein CheW n=1 Tax=Curvibacter soli TaxID=3031331 RepID=UPI0023DCD97E|nr:chemotaxis protein CheW [Ramlibacter sp. H39-3-26]MDF1484866.1 chemotaxis protein CheW [Ramlibacter sp. H39-3-26]